MTMASAPAAAPPRINFPNDSSSNQSQSQSQSQSQAQSSVSSPTSNNPSTPIFDGLPLSPISQISLSSLLSLLDTIPESKTLMLDPSLAGPLGLIADVNSLRQHGVEKMFWMEEEKPKTPKERQSLLKERPIPRNVNAPTRAVVYICRPERRWIRVIASHILSDRLSSSSPNHLSHTYTALLTPRRTELSLLTLSQCGDNLSTDLMIHDFGLEFVPLERDVLSLEEGSSHCSTASSPTNPNNRGDAGFSEIFKDGDHTILHHSAMALMTLQLVYGLFPRILGKGEAGKRLADLLLRQRREHLASDPSNPALTNPSSVIDSLIIIDRSVDLATPLCSQLTYEGLIEEVIGIKSAHVEIDPTLLSGAAPTSTPSGSGVPLQSTQPTKKKKHRLDSTSDSIFATLRDSNFTLVPTRMHHLAKRLRDDFEGRHAAPMSTQHRLFVSKLGSLTLEKQNLQLHTCLQEEIINVTSSEDFLKALEIQQSLIAGVNSYANSSSFGVGVVTGGGGGGKDDIQNQIEELINGEFEMNKVLRLLCLSSITNGGLKAKTLEFVKRELLQTYGYDFLPLLLNLNKVGLLTRDNSNSKDAKEMEREKTLKKRGFHNVRKPLRLIDDDVDEMNPRDISYVYSGYAPLSIRLVQAIAQKESLIEERRNQYQYPYPYQHQYQNQNSNTESSPNDLKSKPRAHPIVGWKGFQEIADSLPGPTFDEIQRPFSPSSLPTTSFPSSSTSSESRPFPNQDPGSNLNHARANANANANASNNVNANANVKANENANPINPPNSDPNKITTTLVFFLGGVTFAEISALRFMNSKTRNRRFLIATTGIISGDGLIEGLK